MKFDSLLSILGDHSLFDLATVVQLSGERRANIRTQLYRWRKAGKLLSLRRGMYALTERYRRTPVHPAELANQLYRPSYLSGLWALGFYGLIPERVVTCTSVTTRVPRRFDNAFGTYRYFNIKRPCFFGYRIAEVQQRKILLADPEKALLDLWHLGKGEWTPERMGEMRFQNVEPVDNGRLEQYAARFASPRLFRAVEAWNKLEKSPEGTVEL